MSFEIVNFYRLHTGRVPGHAEAGGVRFQAAGWEFSLEPKANLGELTDELRNAGGFALTHHGTIRSADGKTFSYAEARRAIESLFYSLSFMRGAWAGPALATFYGRREEIIGEDWRLPKLDRWSPRLTWFDPTLANSIEMVVRSVLPKWTDPDWNRDLKLAISLFVEANVHPSPEGSLVLSQSGLELVAWVALVERQRLYKTKVFNSLEAAERFEHLLSWCKVSKGLPQACSRLRTFAVRHRFKSGPRAITGLRNGIVHPRKRIRTYESTTMQKWDAQQLSLKYLELSILRVLDYGGEYADRLTTPRYLGQTVRVVPWV